MIPKSNDVERIAETYDCLFELDDADFVTIDNLTGEKGERGVRNLETKEYLGFDNFNEEIEEP